MFDAVQYNYNMLSFYFFYIIFENKQFGIMGTTGELFKSFRRIMSLGCGNCQNE